MMLDFSLKQVMRLSSIKRWGIMEMSKDQSVAEHSYNVAMIANMLLTAMFAREGDGHHGTDMDAFMRCEEELFAWTLLEYALSHDLPELATGDIPTPLKKEIGASLSKWEDKEFPNLKTYKSGIASSMPSVLLLCKIADLIDAVQFGAKHCVDDRKEEVLCEMRSRIIQTIRDHDGGIGVERALASAIIEIWNDEKMENLIIEYWPELGP